MDSRTMRYHLRWYSCAHDDAEMDEVFDTEEKMMMFINELVKKYSKPLFSAMYGRKIEFEPSEVITSYKVKSS